MRNDGTVVTANDPTSGAGATVRARWIAWSLRPELRPSVIAEIVRARGGDPPALPVREGDLPVGLELRPNDLKLLRAPAPDSAAVAAMEERAVARGCRILTPEDGGWLEGFWREMTDPPPALFVEGDLHAPDQPVVAIVGSRHPTATGVELARGIARDLAAQGITIVSGLALGIDGAAHRGALDVEGHTVAVLGSGVDRPTPPSHAPLAASILRSGGALLSEFPLGMDPRPLHFPRRNRIIAGFARVIVIVEGSRRSGARSTVDHALAIGREVVAVPRDPIHEGSALPNILLRSGAAPVRSALDILEILEGCCGAARGPSLIDADDSALLDLFETGRPRTVDAIARAAGRPADQVMQSLARLELAGRARRLPGPRFAPIGAHSGRGT